MLKSCLNRARVIYKYFSILSHFRFHFLTFCDFSAARSLKVSASFWEVLYKGGVCGFETVAGFGGVCRVRTVAS